MLTIKFFRRTPTHKIIVTKRTITTITARIVKNNNATSLRPLHSSGHKNLVHCKEACSLETLYDAYLLINAFISSQKLEVLKCYPLVLKTKELN